MLGNCLLDLEFCNMNLLVGVRHHTQAFLAVLLANDLVELDPVLSSLLSLAKALGKFCCSGSATPADLDGHLAGLLRPLLGALLVLGLLAGIPWRKRACQHPS